MRILIVDDEKVICDGMRAILKSIEHIVLEVECVNSVNQAKETIQDFPPDLVISDIEMPGVNGLEFVKYIKEQFPESRVLILSGHDSFGYVRTAFKLQVDDYLLKPIDIEKFQEMVLGIYMNAQYKMHYDEVERIFQKAFPQEDLGEVSPKLAELMHYIQEKYSEGVSLKKLTEVFRCSETYICNLFRQETGKTFLEFLNRVRLRYAYHMLISNPHKSIARISLDLGYSSERQFFRVFKGMTGITPNQLRKMHIKRVE